MLIVPDFVQLLHKLFELRSPHVSPVSFRPFELNWHRIVDKGEWKCAAKCGIGKLVDGSKRIDGVGKLVG